tara:strand:- start:954 stop:1574 length:621 start_codon:yes stop_codon:yes gene_type:complete
MSKKTLLNEATIRRFMKLASLGPLSETFLPEEEEVNEQDELEIEDEEEVIDDPDMGMDDEDLEIEDEVEVDAEVEVEAPVDIEDALTGFIEDIAASAEEHFDVEVNVASDMEDEEVLDLDDEGDEDLEADLDIEDDGDEFEAALDVEEEPAMRDVYEEGDETNVFFETLLQKVQSKIDNLKHDQLAEQLTEKIFQRLTKKATDSEE